MTTISIHSRIRAVLTAAIHNRIDMSIAIHNTLRATLLVPLADKHALIKALRAWGHVERRILLEEIDRFQADT